MYQSHFHLNSRPFAFAPNPEHYYPASSIEQSRAVIALNVERASGTTMVMGAVGSGKTLLCQLIANQFSGELPVCMIPGGRLTTRETLLQTILHSLGLPFRGQNEGELRFTLTDHVAGQSCHNGILLIIDEADRLPLELLEEVRVLTNLVKDGQQRVRLVLARAHRLEELVGDPKLESLNQRVVGRLFLENFSQDETADYVRARINACGGDAGYIFTDDALSMAFRATNGVPRLINQTCDHAMLLGSVANIDQLDEQAIEEAWSDLQQLPIPTAHSEVPPQAKSAVDDVIEFGSLDDDDDAIRDPGGQLDDIQRVVAELETDANQATASIEIGGDVEIEDELAEYALAPEDSVPTANQLLVGEPDYVDAPESDLFDGVQSESVEGEDPWVDSESELELVISDGENATVELTIDQVENPFDEQFAEEEIIIQQFSSPSDFARNRCEHVTSSYSRHLAEQLTAAHPGLRMHPAAIESESASLEGATRDDSAYADEEQFRPLSAYLEEDDELTIVDENSQVTVDFGDNGFDPSDDPVLPEHASEAFTAGVDVSAAKDVTHQSEMEYQLEFGNGADIALVIQDAIAVALEDKSQPGRAAIAPEEPATIEPERQPKKFRTLFSSMRRS